MGREALSKGLMHVVTIGPSSPHVLLLPGFNLNAAFYTPLAEGLLARGVGSTCATLPGFDGQAPLSAPSWHALLDVVAAHVQAHPPTVLAGHSLGGLLALLLVARQRCGIGGLALLEPAVFPCRLIARVGARRYRNRVLQAPTPRFDNFNGGMRRVADLAHFPQSAINAYLACARSADGATGAALFTTLPALYPLQLDAVDVPTLLVTGAASGPLSRFIAWSLLRRLPVERHVRVDGAAHWLVHENTAATVDALAAFAHQCAEAPDAAATLRVHPVGSGGVLP